MEKLEETKVKRMLAEEEEEEKEEKESTNSYTASAIDTSQVSSDEDSDIKESKVREENGLL